MLDYKNSRGRAPIGYSNIRQWLLPPYDLQKRIVATDNTILRSVKNIDAQIIDGRQWINREFGTQGGAVHITVQKLRDWLDEREHNTKSIYTRYCIDSGKC
jgi:hypothetical protein